MKRIVIVGGGISGLTVAYRLHELSCEKEIPIDMTLLEGRSRLGGVIETQSKDGFLLEYGPDALMTDRPWSINLCKRLGIESELIGMQKEADHSYIVCKGKMCRIPTGFYLLAPSNIKALVQSHFLSSAGKLRLAAELFIPKRKSKDDESVGSFIRRRFGREVLERLGEPLLAGIYTAHPDQLSMQAVLPHFREMESKYGSVTRGLWALREKHGMKDCTEENSRKMFVTFKDGMRRLIHALIENMPDVSFATYTPVEKIAFDHMRILEVTIQGGAVIEADAVCLALPAMRSSEIVNSFSPRLAEKLADIKYESVVTVNVAYDELAFPKRLDGAGFVIPSVENRRLVGSIFSSIKFDGRAPKGAVLIRTFLGNAIQRNNVDLDDQEMRQLVTEELRDILGVTREPLFIDIQRYEMSIPQYGLNYQKL